MILSNPAEGSLLSVTQITQFVKEDNKERGTVYEHDAL
jgi:hypothetical protein